jgi:hypothetical protein
MTEVIISEIDRNIENLRFLKETVRENCGTPGASGPANVASRFKIKNVPTSPEGNKIIEEISTIIVKLNELKTNVSNTCNSKSEVARPLPTPTGEKRGRFTIRNLPNTGKGGKTNKHKKSRRRN